MIERFYSSNLTAEMNIEMLQSKRSKANFIWLLIQIEQRKNPLCCHSGLIRYQTNCQLA
jgi:hypothetical protein